MHERFTDRARKVLFLANQEAHHLNHEYLGTEHLLLGLAGEGAGVGATVLKKFGADLATLRTEVAKRVRKGPDTVITNTMGKLPMTPRAKRVVEYAIEEARAIDHNYVGTEHLLLGLLRETEGVATQVLANLGLNLEDIRRITLTMLGVGTAEGPLPNREAEPSRPVDYRSLDLWKKADDLAHAVYQVAGGFPKEEIYGVASHLRRTALLLPPNIAAAYRRSSETETRWFVSVALGLLRELQYGFDFAVKLGVLKTEEHEKLANLAGQIDAELTAFHAALPRPRDS